MKKNIILFDIALIFSLLISCSKTEQEKDILKQSCIDKKDVMVNYIAAYEVYKEMKFKGLEACNGSSIFEDYKIIKNKLLIQYFNNQDYSNEKEILDKLVNEINIATDLNDGIDNYYIFSYNSKILEEIIKSLPSGYYLSIEDMKIFINY